MTIRWISFALLLLALPIGGCGANSSKPSSDAPPERIQGPTPSPTPVPAMNWQNLSVAGKLTSGRFSGTQVLSLDKQTKELILTLPTPANPDFDAIKTEILLGKVPGMRLRIDPVAGGGSRVMLRVPLRALIKGVEFGPQSSLPNGDPLPAILGGQMPLTSVPVPNLKDFAVAVYLTRSGVGLFVPTKFNPAVALSFPSKSDDGRRLWGQLSTIPAKQNFDGGFFISAHLPEDITRVIDDIL